MNRLPSRPRFFISKHLYYNLTYRRTNRKKPETEKDILSTTRGSVELRQKMSLVSLTCVKEISIDIVVKDCVDGKS